MTVGEGGCERSCVDLGCIVKVELTQLMIEHEHERKRGKNAAFWGLLG